MNLRHQFHINAREFAIFFEDKSLTQQQFKEESDPCFIAERFGLTGEMPQVLHLPKYGDYTGVFDYQTAMNVVVAGQRAFMQLPAKLRARFSNSPQEFLQFCADEGNLEEAIRLGLAKRKEPTDENGTARVPATPTQEQAGAPGAQRSPDQAQADKKP